jgi:putative pyridoxal-dependent aspartate 1-decarboxylase
MEQLESMNRPADGSATLVRSLFSSAGDEAARRFRDHGVRLAEAFVNSERITDRTCFADLRRRCADHEIPEQSSSPVDYLKRLEANVIPGSVNVSSPAFIGHMTSALPYFMRDLARIVAAMNQNTVKLETSKCLSALERETLAKLHRLVFARDERFYAARVQDPASTLGVITSGGTVANITALWCARNAGLAAQGDFAGVEAEGMAAALRHYGYRGAAIIGSEMMHYSFEKAAGVLGIGCRNLLKIPVDERHRVSLDATRSALARCRDRGIFVVALVGVAGATESGAIDPLPELADLAQEHHVHFHVDAAWGGALLFSRVLASKLRGIELADTVTIDGHKQLYTPVGSGVGLFRNCGLAQVIDKQARYVIRRGSHDLGRRSLEGSRPANVLFLHAALTILGRQGLEFLLDDNVRKARYMYERIQASAEFESLIDPQMNILVYRYLPQWARGRSDLSRDEQQSINDLNASIQRAQRNAGKRFVSRTMLATSRYGAEFSILALRAVIANPLTAESSIDAVLEEQLWRAHELERHERYAVTGALPAS